MAEINKDKQVIADGRRAPLKDVDASLRDQVVDKLFTKLEEMQIGPKVVSLWNKGSYNRQRWLERQKAYLASWDEHLVGNTEGAFEGSSQLHIPMPFIVCKTLHARYLQALWQDPPFNVKARNEASIDRIGIVSDTMRFYLMDGANYDQGVEREADMWVWRWITQGSGLMKLSWDVKYTRFVDVTQVPAPGKPKVTIGPDGKEQVIQTTKFVEKEINVTKKTFEGPLVVGRNVEDVVIIGGGGDPDMAEAVIEQDWLTASDLWTLGDRKVFKSDRVEEVIEGGPDKESGVIAADLKTQRMQNAGKTSLDFDKDHDRYRLLEAYLQVDVDGSGINTDVVVWVHARSMKLMRATYLHRISPKGERPYAKADFHLREGQEYGVGMPELLYPLSQEMDAIHNMRIDSGLIATMPFGFYRASSGIDPETLTFAPGSLFPVDNPQTDVYFPNLGNRTVFGMQEESALQNMVERLTSISDINLGLTSSQGPTRTATGSNALMNEMSSNLDVYLRRLNRGWKKVLRYLLHMLQKRIPPGLSFRVTGEDGQDYWQYIKSQDDLAGDYDLEVSPNSSTSNASVQQSLSQEVLQLVSNPLAMQMQSVGPGQYYEAMKFYLMTRGVKDYSKFIQKPQGYERQLTPLEECDHILRGMEVPLVPNMDHQGFIDFVDHIMADDHLLGQFQTHEIGLLVIQKKKHQQMMQALQAQQAQQANASQQQINSQMNQNPVQAGPFMQQSGPAVQPPPQMPTGQ